MKHLKGLALFPAARKDQNHDARDQDGNADPLRGVERSVLAARRVAAEHLDDKPPDRVQDEIPAGHGAEVLFLAEDEHEHNAQKQQEDRFQKRRRQAHGAVEVFHRADAVVGAQPELRRFAGRNAVAAADQQTADPPERMRHAEARRHEVREFEEILFLLPRNENDAQKPADQSAVEDHARHQKLQKPLEEAV